MYQIFYAGLIKTVFFSDIFQQVAETPYLVNKAEFFCLLCRISAPVGKFSDTVFRKPASRRNAADKLVISLVTLALQKLYLLVSQCLG